MLVHFWSKNNAFSVQDMERFKREKKYVQSIATKDRLQLKPSVKPVQGIQRKNMSPGNLFRPTFNVTGLDLHTHSTTATAFRAADILNGS